MRRYFLKSPHHAALAAATLGLGFASGEPLYFIVGAAAYVVGWVFLPDLPFFRKWVGKKQAAANAAAAAGELADFKAKRDQALAALTRMVLSWFWMKERAVAESRGSSVHHQSSA